MDWLANQHEAGQTFDEFVASEPNRPEGSRSVVYFQPIGEFGEDAPSRPKLSQFTSAFFGLRVEWLDPLPTEGLGVTERLNELEGERQLLTGDLLKTLKKRLPDDAYCELGVTMVDLYPREGWNYVFGAASLKDRVGVYSFARYDPAFYGNDRSEGWRELVLLRSCKVLAHETGHMFGLAHCVHFDCLMNGSNHLAETDSHPLFLCPVCLRKLHSSVGFDPRARYQALEAFCRENGLSAEAQWLQRRLAELAE